MNVANSSGTCNYVKLNSTTGRLSMQDVKVGSETAYFACSTPTTGSYGISAGSSFQLGSFSLQTASITTSANPLGVGQVTGGGDVLKGQIVTVTASVTDPCYQFSKWTANGKTASTFYSYSFAATTNEALVAMFSQLSYDIKTASSPPQGGATTGGGNKACGSVVNLNAVAKPGFRFSYWSMDGTAVSTGAATPLWQQVISASRPILLTSNHQRLRLHRLPQIPSSRVRA